MNVNPNQETELVGHLSFLSVKYWMKHLQIVISFSLGQLESHWNSLDNQTKNRPGCSNKKVELKWITCPKTKYLWTIRDEKCFLLDMQMILRCVKKKTFFNPFHHDPDGSKQQWRQHLTWINHSSSFSNFQSPNPKNIVYKTPKKKSLTYLDCWISLIHLTFFKLLCLNKFSIVEEKEPVPFLVFLKKKKI